MIYEVDNEMEMFGQDTKALVIGAGVSGLAAAKMLSMIGTAVTIADNKPKEALPAELFELEEDGVEICVGCMPKEVSDYNFAVISPGIPLTVPVVQALKAARVPVISELELAYLYTETPFVAITGTNGKTTTTALVGHILDTAGIDVFLGGNIGVPLTANLTEINHDGYVVAEVSSFQLETVYNFAPKVAAVLNFAPDHLDRHGDMAGYITAKARIFAKQEKEDFLVLNYDDEQVRALAEKAKAQVVFFSRKDKLEHGFCVSDNKIIWQKGPKTINIIDIDEIYIKGGHNVENALAACAVAASLGVKPEKMAEALKTFKGVAHRQEFVALKKGVKYINDSKGTNPDSTKQAIMAYQEPMVLILGGRNKGSEFDELLPFMENHVKSVVLVGEAADEIKACLQANGFTAVCEAGSDFNKAVALAAKAANVGDVVMLSPACASWDMFNCFEERGDLFKKLVLALPD